MRRASRCQAVPATLARGALRLAGNPDAPGALCFAPRPIATDYEPNMTERLTDHGA